MPNFTNTPPVDPRGVGLPLRRCPSMGAICGIVTSSDLIGCPTHFFGGRTVPCEQNDCEPCLNGIPWRWHSYCSCWSPENKIHFLFENTARASEPFVQYRDAHVSLRGCLFRAHRNNNRPNGRVYIETKPADLEKLALPEAPNLENVLSIIWNLPLPTLETGTSQRNMPQVRVDPSILSDEQHLLKIDQLRKDANQRKPPEVPRSEHTG